MFFCCVLLTTAALRLSCLHTRKALQLILSFAGMAVVAAGQAAKGRVLACSGWLAVLRTAACERREPTAPGSQPAPTSGAGGCAGNAQLWLGFVHNSCCRLLQLLWWCQSVADFFAQCPYLCAVMCVQGLTPAAGCKQHAQLNLRCPVASVACALVTGLLVGSSVVCFVA